MNAIKVDFAALRDLKHRAMAHKIDFVLRPAFRS